MSEKQKQARNRNLPSVKMPSGFSVVTDGSVQPNVDITCAIVFDSDVAWRDIYEHRSLFASKGSNLLLMACLDAMVSPVTHDEV